MSAHVFDEVSTFNSLKVSLLGPIVLLLSSNICKHYFIFQIFLIVSLASAVLAAPQNYGNRPGGGGGGGNFQIIPILSDNRNGPLNGVYDFDFETGDGIRRNEQGAPTGPNGAVVQQGGWR